MQEKDAGGEILGGLAGLLSRPFIGAARSGDVRQRIVDTLTRRINNPLERGLHGLGVGKLIEGGAHAAAYLGGAPEAIRTPWAREQAANIVRTIASHPDAAAFSGITTFTAPIPGITEAYLGTKGLATKALERLTTAPPVPRVVPTGFPLPAEPTYLKLPPKIAAAYAEGRKAALEKFAFLLV